MWLTIATWPALLPFFIGAALAYAVLPLVNAMDTVLPRFLASLFAMVIVLAGIVAVFVIILPPMARGVGQLAQELPTREEIATWIASVQASLGDQGGPVAPRLAELMEGLVAAARGGLTGSTEDLAELAPAVLQGVIGAVSAVLGLVVLPTWILTVVKDQRVGRGAIFAAMPAAFRADLWAVVRMVDRVAATYIRGGVPLGIMVGVIMWLGLSAVERLGFSAFREAGPISVLAGAFQVIPEIGPLIGFLPALLILPISVERAVIYVVVYVASRWLATTILGRRAAGRNRLHPAILVPAIVALTQFGLLWLFLAGPMLAIGFDFVRYVNGRLSSPARPAGLIPDEAPDAASAGAAAVQPLPTRRAPVIIHG